MSAEQLMRELARIAERPHLYPDKLVRKAVIADELALRGDRR